MALTSCVAEDHMLPIFPVEKWRYCIKIANQTRGRIFYLREMTLAHGVVVVLRVDVWSMNDGFSFLMIYFSLWCWFLFTAWVAEVSSHSRSLLVSDQTWRFKPFGTIWWDGNKTKVVSVLFPASWLAYLKCAAVFLPLAPPTGSCSLPVPPEWYSGWGSRLYSDILFSDWCINRRLHLHPTGRCPVRQRRRTREECRTLFWKTAKDVLIWPDVLV